MPESNPWSLLARRAGLLVLAAVAAHRVPARAQGCVELGSGAVAWWSLDESSGTLVSDRVGGQGGAHANGSGPCAGLVRGGACFDGANDFIQVPDDPLWNLAAGDFTIELWARFDSPGGGSVGHPSHIFIGNDEGPGNARKWFFALGGGFLNFHVNGPSLGAQFFPLVPFGPVVGQWYHLAVVREGSRFSIYVDGALAGSETRALVIQDANAPLTLGQAEGIGFMHGGLDEVTLYHRALAPEEILAVASAGQAGKCIELAVFPDRIGDTGLVSVRVRGVGFQAGASVALVRTGEAEITSLQAEVLDEGTSIAATVDPRGRLHGLWDLEVRNPDGSVLAKSDAMTIESGQAPPIRVQLVGLGLIRPTQPQVFHVLVENLGNVDALAVPLWIAGIPASASWTLAQEVEPPAITGLEDIDWSTVPISFESNGEQVIPLVLGRVPAGGQVAYQISVSIPALANFTLRAWASAPLLETTELMALSSPTSLELCVGSALEVIVQAVGLIPTASCTVAMVRIALDQFVEAALILNRLKTTSLSQILTSSLLYELRLAQACVFGEIPGLSQILEGVQLGLALVALQDNCFSPGEAPPASLPVVGVDSLDPNQKTGLIGTGSERFITGSAPLSYAIYFENDREATAPVQELVIRDELDLSVLDPSSLGLGAITLGTRTIFPDPGQGSFAADVDLRPENELIVRIRASLDLGTGVLTWRMSSVDPLTGNPPTNPLAGFLPPNVVAPEGDGSVLFEIALRDTVTDGTLVQNQAEIVFDGSPMLTQVWENTIDDSAPESAVLPLASVQSESPFPVAWAGTDSGSGVASYSVYVSEDGGGYSPWLERVTATSGLFTGRPGREYRFYSVARDAVGNEEMPPATFDASTRATKRTRPAR